MDVSEIVARVFYFLKFNQLYQCRKVNNLFQAWADDFICAHKKPLKKPQQLWLRSCLKGQRMASLNEKWMGNQISETFFIGIHGLYVCVYSNRSHITKLITYQIWFRTCTNKWFMMKWETSILMKQVYFRVVDGYLMIFDTHTSDLLCSPNLNQFTFDVKVPLLSLDFSRDIECLKHDPTPRLYFQNEYSLSNGNCLKITLYQHTSNNATLTKNKLDASMWTFHRKITDISLNGECFLIGFFDRLWDYRLVKYLILLVFCQRNNGWYPELFDITEIYLTAKPVYDNKTRQVLWSKQTHTGFKLFPSTKINPPRLTYRE